MARRLARLIGSQQLRRVALLAADGLHGDSGVRAMIGALRAADVKLQRSVRLPRTGADLSDAVERALSTDPEAVVVWGTAPGSGSAARQLRRAGHRGPLFFDAGAVERGHPVGQQRRRRGGRVRRPPGLPRQLHPDHRHHRRAGPSGLHLPLRAAARRLQ